MLHRRYVRRSHFPPTTPRRRNPRIRKPPRGHSQLNPVPNRRSPPNREPISHRRPIRPGRNLPQMQPPFKVGTVPPGSVKRPPSDSPDDGLYRLVVRTNQVVIPVRVTDDSGHMVEDLQSPDFAVYEDGKKQTFKLFQRGPVCLVRGGHSRSGNAGRRRAEGEQDILRAGRLVRPIR